MNVISFNIILVLTEILVAGCSNSPSTTANDNTNSQVTTPQQTSIPAVTDLKGIASPMKDGSGKWQIALTWTEYANTELAYTIKRTILSNKYSPCDPVDTTCDVQTYPNSKSGIVISNLKPDSTQYFKVYVSNINNANIPVVESVEFAIKVPLDTYTTKPGTFVTSSIPGDGQVTLSWTNSDRATFYIIQSGKTAGSYPDIISNLAKSPFIAKGLTNGETRYYIVIAVNSVGSATSNEVHTTPLAAPGNFSLSTSAGDSKVTLNWGSASNATNYVVSRSETEFGIFSDIASIPSDGSSTYTHDDTAVTNGLTYFYKITATIQGESCGTLVSCQTTLFQTLSNVSSASPLLLPNKVIVSGTPGNSMVRLSWTAQIDTTYTVQYSTTSGSYTNSFSTTATSPIDVTGLSNGTTYYFRVIAVNANGSTNADEIYTTPLASPGSFSLSLSGAVSKVTLNWGLASDATNYIVARSGSASGTYVDIASIPATLATSYTYDDNNVSNGTQYYYKVRAMIQGQVCDASANCQIVNITTYSNISNATPLALPNQPSVTSSPGNTKVTLSWTAQVGVSYTVQSTTISGSYSESFSTSAISPIDVTSLTNGTTYYFRVIAINANGESTNANEVSGIPIDTTPQYVTDDLILDLDASLAQNGTSFPGTGCGLSSWFDLSQTANPGALTNFYSCNSSTGWLGSGISTDPYRLKFLTSHQSRVILPYKSVYDFDSSTSYTMNAWIRYSGIAPWYTGILSRETTYSFYQLVLRNDVISAQVRGDSSPTWDDLQGTTSLNDNSWHYVSFVFKRSTREMILYVDGRLENKMITGESSYPLILGTRMFIGAARENNIFFNGDIAQATMYKAALSQAQIVQNCNAFKDRFSGASCQNPIDPSTPVSVSAGANDTSINLKWIDPSDASATYSISRGTISGSLTPLVSGLTTASYLDTGLSNGSTYFYIVSKVLSGGTTIDSAEVSASPIALPSVVTDNLVLSLDAATAQGGTNFPGTGCGLTSWFDLSPTANNGSLQNFYSCGSNSGWNGDGTPADPYRLSFNRNNSNKVFLSYNNAYNFSPATSFSLAAWIRYSTTAPWYTGIISRQTTSTYYQLVLVDDKISFQDTGTGSVTWDDMRGTTRLNDNQWHYVTLTADKNSQKISLYVDGRLENQKISSEVSYAISNTNGVFIGAARENNIFFNGDIATATIYNTALSQGQITQNCNALKVRFSGATCE